MKPNLKFNDFEVTFNYGFILDPFDYDSFEEIKEQILSKQNCLCRDSWVSHYQNNKTTEIIQIFDLDEDKNKAIDLRLTLNDSQKFEWPSAKKDLVTSNIRRSLTISNEGFGSLSISLFFKSIENDLLNVPDVLRSLLLVPKTHLNKTNGDKINGQWKTKNIDWDSKITPKKEWFSETYLYHEFNEKWGNFSVPYQIFAYTLLTSLPEGFPKWTPILSKSDIIRFKTINAHKRFEFIKSHSDPQIPYMLVNCSVPLNIYRRNFLIQPEQNLYSSPLLNYITSKLKYKISLLRRRLFTNEISAILNRWLIYKNSKLISNESPELNQMKYKGCFQNQYMNSLSFTVYSSLVTLILKPTLPSISEGTISEIEILKKIYSLKNKDFNFLEFPIKKRLNNIDRDQIKEQIKRVKLLIKPIQTTSEGILKCIEISKIRWHQAIWLNIKIDDLVLKMNDDKESTRFLHYFKYLSEIEKLVARNFEKPDSYFWDATVGTSLAEFLQVNIIEKIENELINKINIVRNLILDTINIQGNEY